VGQGAGIYMFAENYPYMPFTREMRRRYQAGQIGEVRYAEAEYLDEPADLSAMVNDQQGQLRWASASDQTAQAVEDGQERLAQGPCMVAFSQRAPAVIRDIGSEPDWGELVQVMLGEGICAALSVPVELDGSPIGTLDIYNSGPWDWDDSEIAAAQAYAGVVASLLTAAVTAQVKGRLANQLQAALEHRWLIEQAKGMLMGRERLDAQAAFERLRRVARSSSRRLADVAREVTAGKPLPLANRSQRGPSLPGRVHRQDPPSPDS
jgi:GAF domain-containing protein